MLPNPYPGFFLYDMAEFFYAVDYVIECGKNGKR
jgi:hypothetical protein